MSLVKQVILNADEELRYPTPGELKDDSQTFCKTGNDRIQIARKPGKSGRINCRKTPAPESSGKSVPEPPVIPAVGSKQLRPNEMSAGIFRLISYCLLAGNAQPLQDIGLTGMKELYTNIGIPLTNILQYIRCLKEEAIKQLDEADAAEVIPYFDHIIQELALPGPPYFMNDGPGEKHSSGLKKSI